MTAVLQIDRPILPRHDAVSDIEWSRAPGHDARYQSTRSIPSRASATKADTMRRAAIASQVKLPCRN